MGVTTDATNFPARAPSQKGKWAAYVVCWLLGNGTLFSWNSMLTVEDYFSFVFPDYHPVRVFTLVYQPFALATIAILTYHEARINTRLRILFGYSFFFLLVLLIPVVSVARLYVEATRCMQLILVASLEGLIPTTSCIISNIALGQLDLATSGRGGVGPYIGTCVLIAGFGVADAHVQGGMYGDLSFMQPEFIQSYAAGLAASGAATSALRMITKAAFENSKNGLRKGTMIFFFVSAFFELLCIVLYAFIFPRLEAVTHYRLRAAVEGSLTVTADLAAGGVAAVEFPEDKEPGPPAPRLSNIQLTRHIADYVLDIVLIYVLSLSIFPGFLSEDTGHHQLGSWYAITLIAMFNVGDLIGRYVPLMDFLMLKSRGLLTTACFIRFLLVPAFYFTAKYGDQGWMLMLTIVLGLSNGYLTVCVFVNAPKGFKGPEQNAIGNILVLFLIIGLFLGVTLDWLWLIGKGW